MRIPGFRAAAAAALLSIAGNAVGASADLNVSDDALRINWAAPLSAMSDSVDALYDAGLLLGKHEDERYVQGHLGALVTGDAGARDANVTAGLGARLVILDEDDFTGQALALGGQVEARVPAFNRIGAFAYAYGAPQASAFGDFDGYLEYAVAADYAVLRNASVYAGFRQIKIDVDPVGTLTVDTGWHVGLRLTF